MSAPDASGDVGPVDPATLHPHLQSTRTPATVRVDCHTHTCFSGDAVTTIEEYAARVSMLDVDVVCVTDHHSIRGALELLDLGLTARIVVGEEIRTHEGELIGLFLTERIPPGLPLEETVAHIRAQGGITYVPHPFDPARRPLRADALRDACARGWIDAVEVFNAKTANPDDNAAARALADEFALPAGAGSDAHDAAALGAAYVEMPDFDGPKTFLASLRAAQVVGHHFDPPRVWKARVIPKGLRPSS